MKAVILAAGKGERLGTITQEIPKPMIEIAGKPILEHNILMCKNNSIEEIFINLHHLPLIIKHYFGNGAQWGVRISYKYEPKLLGTAGAVNNFCKELLDMPFFVIYGDNYFDFDLHVLRQFHEEKQSDFTIALSKLDDISNSGIVELKNNGKIHRFIEKPINARNNNSWINAGIYFVEPIILNEIKNGYADFGKDVIPLLIKNGYNIYGYKMKKNVLPIDTPELLKKQSTINQKKR